MKHMKLKIIKRVSNCQFLIISFLFSKIIVFWLLRIFTISLLEYAVKIVDKAQLAIPEKHKKLQSEIKIHKEVQYLPGSSEIHENVVRFYKSFDDDKKVYILLDLCENLSLDWLLRRRIRLKEVEVRCYAAQIINVLKHFKQKQIIHRDLKLGNLFLTDKMQIKVGDFGLATEIHNGKRRYSIWGTPNYIGKILNSFCF